MSCPEDQQGLDKLRQFLSILESKPEILHLPELDFFRKFIEGFGGTIPAVPKSSDSKAETPKPTPETMNPDEAFDEQLSDPESDLELDMDGCVEPDKLEDSQKMGDASKEEISEEDSDKADEKRREAMAQFSEGYFEKAIDLYTEAIELNPQSALLFAKRGQAYLRLNKPNACVRDCTRALQLNPDSAAAYKFRGRAYRLLGEFELAAKDLRQACNIDFDEQTDEWLKEVTPNAKKIEEHELKRERRKKEKEDRERKERIRKTKEPHMPFGGAGAAGGARTPMDDIYKMFNDPEIVTALKDPEVAAAFEDINKNPGNIIKYQSNPKISALLAKITNKLAGSGGVNMEGMPFGGAGGPGANPPPPSGGGSIFDLD